MNLEQFRKEMDVINEEIVLLLEKRVTLARKIGSFKKKHELPAVDKEREENEIKAMVAKSKLDPKFITKIFTLLFNYKH